MAERPASADHLSRRGFLGLGAGAAASVAFLAACGGSSGTTTSSSGGSGGALKFWDMPWGGTAYNPAAKNLVATYKPASGLPAATYQTIQWANFERNVRLGRRVEHRSRR